MYLTTFRNSRNSINYNAIDKEKVAKYYLLRKIVTNILEITT
jgi:hypothetical protein